MSWLLLILSVWSFLPSARGLRKGGWRIVHRFLLAGPESGDIVSAPISWEDSVTQSHLRHQMLTKVV